MASAEPDEHEDGRPPLSPDAPLTLPPPGTSVVLTGQIVHSRACTDSLREIKVALTALDDRALTAADEAVDALVSVHASGGTAEWFRISGARKLLSRGVVIEVKGVVLPRVADGGGGDGDGEFCVREVALRVCGALPEPAYVARCVGFAKEEAALLFCGDASASQDAVNVSLASVLQPCSVERLAALRACPALQTKVKTTVFKEPALVQLCKDMREALGWESAMTR